VDAAHELGLDSISFLPADVSSEAFNRHIPWTEDRQHEVLIPEEELPLLKSDIDSLILSHAMDFDLKYIVESRDKIRDILKYYEAIYGLNDFPVKHCNAPWVSAVIEADGNVRPCFFHPPVGNIKNESFENILNNPRSLAFRRQLNPGQNSICKKCVCSLSLPFHKNPVA
jgi:MoaA/NifB/PqqE/SkfB family radical SAM enzyme